MMRRTLFTLIVLLSYFTGQANDSRLRALLEAGQQRLVQQRFYEAEAYFLKVLELDDHNAEAHYYLADCKRHRFRYPAALSLYQTVQNLDSGAFPLADYYAALMQKQTGAYRTAHQAFEDFITHHESGTDPLLQEFINRARREIEGIKLVYELTLQSSREFSFQPLPAPINSPAHDYAAQALSHDSSLLLSSTRSTATGNTYDERYGEHLSDLFLFKKNQQQWTQQTDNRWVSLNSDLNEGSGVFNAARDQFYFTGCYQDSTCRILVSQLVDEEWSDPLPLNDRINLIGYNTKHPALSVGGDTLYFTSDRPGGYGQFDLWMSIRINGTWQAPANLGPTINTSRDEVSPEYYADERALLFASNGQISMGGYDLYVTHLAQSSRPEVVSNLGFPFNSPQDDLYMSVGHQQAFLTSNRNNEDGNFDVYTFRIQPDDIYAIARHRPGVPVDWYELQLPSTTLFAPEDREFFEQLPLADKVKATHYIKRRSFREAVSEQIAQTTTTAYQYETLSEQDQALVRRLAKAKQHFVQKEFTEEVSSEDRRHYESLSPAKKEEIDQLVNQRWFKQLLQETASPEEEAVYFYEKLPVEEQRKIERAIREQRTLHQRAFLEQPTLEDIFYYQSLPSDEKSHVEQMIVAQQFMERVWEAAPSPEMDYVYQQLTPDEQQQIKRYVGHQSFQLAMAESTVLSEEIEQHYEALSPQEKESVRRLARAKKQFLMREPVDDTSLADRQFYERLPTQEKEIVTQVIDAQVFALLVRDETPDQDEADVVFEQLPTQDQQRVTQAITRRKEFHQRTFRQLPTVDEVFAYQALSDEEKISVRRLSGTHDSLPPISPRPRSWIKTRRYSTRSYPVRIRKSVERLVANRKNFLLKGEPTALSLEDQYFLETLTTEEKQQRMKRVVAARVFDELMNEEMQTTQLTFRYQNLYGQEKRRVDRLAQSRRFFRRVAEEDTSTPPDYFSLQKIAERPSERVAISGRLSSLRPGKFPSRVFLVNDQQDTLATAAVRSDGTFTFTKVAYQEDHRVAFDQSVRSFTRRPAYQLEELSVVSLADTLLRGKKSTQFDNIYFATNQHALPSSATSTLDSVLHFHRQHPEISIEIRAFADSTGTRAYNFQLTQRRSHSVQQYLTARGVDPNRLSQVAMGSVSGRDLAFCRRVEVSTEFAAPLPSLTQTIYVIQAKPDLRQIAERYRVSWEKLLEWNNGKENVDPYTPVRVVVEAGR